MKKVYLGYTGTTLKRVPETRGLSIEEELRIAETNKEPIEATAPMIYTEKAKGVLPEFDIRTDKQEIALDLVDKAQKSAVMKQADKPSEEETNKEEPTFVTEE